MDEICIRMQLFIWNGILNYHGTISGYVPSIALDFQKSLYNRKSFSVTHSIILACRTSIVIDHHVRSKLSGNCIMGSYKYHSGLAKPRAGVVEWWWRIEISGVLTPDHTFELLFHELLKLEILFYSTSFAIISAAPS